MLSAKTLLGLAAFNAVGLASLVVPALADIRACAACRHARDPGLGAVPRLALPGPGADVRHLGLHHRLAGTRDAADLWAGPERR